MKIRDAKELKTKSNEELANLEKGYSQNLLQARIRHGVGQLENTASLREIRRDIARVKTLQQAKSKKG